MNNYRISFQGLTLLFVLGCVLLLAAPLVSAQGQGGASQPGAHVDKKGHYSFVPPTGYRAWTPDEVQAFTQGLGLTGEVPEEGRAALEQLRANLLWSMFTPKVPGQANQSIKIIYGYPMCPSLDDFARSYKSLRKDPVIHSKETITLNYRPAYLIDGEFDLQGLRFRQLFAYVPGLAPLPGIGPASYQIAFSCTSVEFENLREGFLKSLKTFKPLPSSEVPPEMLQSRYAKKTRPGEESTPLWRSTEVIASIVVVAAAALYFVIRGLMKGAAGGDAAPLPGAPSDSSKDGEDQAK